MVQNKKIKKYKTNENTVFFRNKEIKIKKLTIAELTNTNNIKKSSHSQNQNLEVNKNVSENKMRNRYSTNITETIKSSRSDNFQKLLDKKKDSFKTIQINNENEKKEGINLKKLSITKENGEGIGLKLTNLKKKDSNSNNINYNFNKDILSSRRILTNNENNNKLSSFVYKMDINNKDNNIKSEDIEKNEFKGIKTKLINTELKPKTTIKNSSPHKVFNLQNEIENNRSISIKDNLLKSDNSLPCQTEIVNNNQHYAYKKKIMHKINNFSVNIKDCRKSAISFNKSVSPAKKDNNSSFFN